MSSEKKSMFSKLGFIFVSAGSAIGLGNIWRFPYLVTENGGGTFIGLYIIFALFIGLSVMLSEFVIGRYLGHPFMDNFHKMKYKKIFAKAIYFNLFITLVLIAFYFVISGWTFYYFLNSLLGMINYNATNTNAYYEGIFANLLDSPIILSFFSFIITATTLMINYKGIVAGVEKVNMIFLPTLFILLIVLTIRILYLDNSELGIKYILTFDFSKVKDAILPALGQALFSLSVAMGTMLVFSSHTSKKHDLTRSAFAIVFMGSFVGIFATLLIIPALFAFGYEINSGPGLTFLTLPQVFAKIKYGSTLGSIFFLIIYMAALTSALSLVESAIPYITKIFNTSRKKAILLILLYCIIINTFLSLSLNIFSDVKIFGMGIFDFVSGVFLDLCFIGGALLVSLMLIYGISKEDIKKELTNDGTLNFYMFDTWLFVARYITPTIITTAILFSLLA